MIRLSTKTLLASTAFVGMLSSAFAAELPQLTLTPVPGKETCAALPAGTHPMNPQLCVVQGTFAHDVYTLKLEGRTALKGIDDQTTTGISAKYKNETVQLRCAPQEIFPKETPDATFKEVKRLMPSASDEEAKHIVDLLGTGPMGMELGRLCTASSEGTPLLSAQVLFK